MVQSQIKEGANQLFKACVVTTYAPENLKPQRLITHAAASGAQVAVTQAGWYGEVIGDQSGPSCVLLTHPEAEALDRSIQRLIAAETPFFKNHHVSSLGSIDVKTEFVNEKSSTQFLWQEVAKALLKWENHQNNNSVDSK